MAKKEKLFYMVNVYSTTYTDYGAEDDEVLLTDKPLYRWAESLSALESRIRHEFGWYDRILDKDMGDLGCLRIKYRFEIEEAEYEKPDKHVEKISILDLEKDEDDWLDRLL